MITFSDCLDIITTTFKGNKMSKFKVGDKVNIFDGSYCFGIQNGKYSDYCDCRDGSRNNLTVVATDLSVVKLRDYSNAEQNNLSGEFSAVNDLLVTDGRGNFWFTQSRFCRPVEPTHTLVIEGVGTITLSHKQYLALREQLV